MWRIAGHALMRNACDTIPHHVHPVSSVVFFGLPTSSLDTPHKSCDNGAKAIEETPADSKFTTHRVVYPRAADTVLRPLLTRLRGLQQPVIRVAHACSSLQLALWAC